MEAWFWPTCANLLPPLGAFTTLHQSGSSSGSALTWQGLAASVTLNYTWWGSDLEHWVNWLLAEHWVTSHSICFASMEPICVVTFIRLALFGFLWRKMVVKGPLNDIFDSLSQISFLTIATREFWLILSSIKRAGPYWSFFPKSRFELVILSFLCLLVT